MDLEVRSTIQTAGLIAPRGGGIDEPISLHDNSLKIFDTCALHIHFQADVLIPHP